MKKILLITLLSLTQLFAVVQTTQPVQTQRIYLGSFLANGHLSANKIFRIDTPVGGIVEKLNANIYDTVQKGDLLVTLKSPKILELESQYIDALIEKEYYTNEVNRLKPLYKAAVVAKKSFLRAKNTLTKFTTKSDFYYHLLIEWGLSKSQADRITKTKKPIAKIKIFAPISGKISDLNIYPKMYVQDGTHLMTILNAAGTHLEVSLPATIAKRLHKNATLYISNTPVVVESIAAKLDSRTQTLAVHLLPIKSMHILPDEKRNIKLYWPKNAFVLPASAIIDFKGNNIVFIKKANAFAPIHVTVLGRNNDKVYVVAKELKKTSQVAVTGVITLKGTLESKND